MSSSKTFQHQSNERSEQAADRALKPATNESFGEETFEWTYPPPKYDNALWQRPLNAAPRAEMMLHLQHTIGNQAVQRMIAPRRGNGSFAVDDDTQARIHRERGGGQPLDPAVQVQMSRGIGHDFSDVRIHTSTEADDVSRQLGAIAFTTGQDIFFRAGKYDPASSSGQELLAHELTHVVQQSSGAMGTGQRMTVNPPDDAYEQAADAMAQQVVTAASPLNQAVPSVQAGSVQREAMPEEEELLQTKTDPGASIQREEMPEEDLLQTKADPGTMIQREETPEAELLQTKLDPSASIQREEMPEEEELLQTKIEPGASLQREEMPEEEELQMKAEPGPWVQRQDDGNDAPDAIIPVTVPSVSGTAELTSLDGGNPYFDQAFGKWKYKADALTTAEFLAPTFTTTGEKASPAKGCDGCDNKDCLKVSATAVITFDVNVNVDLPSGSDFTDLKECEQKQVQTAIDTILKPHEQKHVAAFKTYKGKITKPVSALACRDEVTSGAALTAAADAIANAEGSTRSASARAASKKLDPFEVNADLKDCEDKQSLGPGGDQSQPSDVAYA